MFGNAMQSSPAPAWQVLTTALTAGLVLGLTASLPTAAAAADKYKVKKGDTLAAIAEEHGIKGDDGWRRIFDANEKLDNPDLIVPGQVLRIPDKGEKVKQRDLPEARRSQTAASRSSDRTSTPASAPSGSVWTRLAACESGGNWSANTGNGYYGGLQFSLSSWRAVGGSGYPHEASAGTQIAMGQRLQARQGWGAWPGCSAKLGLR